MLQLHNIVKTYEMGTLTVSALNEVSLDFRESEFVSVLGPSGCGKTTLLNIIGGLDRYTSGDLIIDGVSTKEYKDGDWDIYRNKSIGFVFQSYNLIPHQTVLSNVELALTLAGISKEDRKKRATEALEKVGLGDQLTKRPSQMSGGQMQRVAIARALVNNPKILLADEPTGALDTTTSIQIMELLKEVAKDRIVIMVTHNPEIAEHYSNRIIKLLDGKVISDSNPYHIEKKATPKANKKQKKISLSLPTALSLSFKNLLTKKTRTILTAFAGSIGIIGIALILSLSNGMNQYIDKMVSDTLTTYPLEIEEQSVNIGALMGTMMANNTKKGATHDLMKIYSNNILTDMMSTYSEEAYSNDLKTFKSYIESAEGEEFSSLNRAIQYGYELNLQIYQSDTTQEIVQVNPSPFIENIGAMTGSGSGGRSFGMANMKVWDELLEDQEALNSQYEIVTGQWPENYNEVVLIVDQYNEISDLALYSLGLLDSSEIEDLQAQIMKGEEIGEQSVQSFSYEDILSSNFKLVLNTDYYQHENGQWVSHQDDPVYMKTLLQDAVDIKVVGIVRPHESDTPVSVQSNIGYTSALTRYVVSGINESEIAKAQITDPQTNVFTGFPFDTDSAAMTMDEVNMIVAALPEEQQVQMNSMFESMNEEDIIAFMSSQMASNSNTETSSYEDNVSLLGIVDYDSPNSISLYPKDLNAKERIIELIKEYNTRQNDAGHEEYVINYTDLVGMMTSSLQSVIDIISYVLIAFVSISLVVSSIMIAIITYISVLERTKEIGILRSIGASKADISRVFNAETIIEGLVAGSLGVGIAVLLGFPINAIINSLVGIEGISSLSFLNGTLLILLSVFLTVAAGFIPSKIAAKKDPVVALRSE